MKKLNSLSEKSVTLYHVFLKGLNFNNIWILFCFFFMVSDVINQYFFVCATITEHIIVKNQQFNVYYGEMTWPSQRMRVSVLKCISREFRENQKTNFFCSWEAFDISMEESGK